MKIFKKRKYKKLNEYLNDLFSSVVQNIDITR